MRKESILSMAIFSRAVDSSNLKKKENPDHLKLETSLVNLLYTSCNYITLIYFVNFNLY